MSSDPFRRKSNAEIMEEMSFLKKGHLKIYLGAGSKTGKTYTMLHDGYDLLASGMDVVLSGVSEEHPLEEFVNEAPLSAIPIIKSTDEKISADLNVQAILARRPDILLVDDLAHVNQPGARFSTRLDDVAFLLEQGIHVMTTLNIYDIEELRQNIKKLTGIEVRHTVPLSVVAGAHEIKLIDVDPEAVLKRLEKEKKGDTRHPPELNQDALSILREFALRLIADDVNERLEQYRKTHAVQNALPAAEKILVALSYNSNGTLLIRRGQQLANRLNGELHIMTVTDEKRKKTTEELAFKDAILKLADKVDATFYEALRTPAASISKIIVDYAQTHAISRIVIGQSRRSRLEEWRKGSILNELLEQAKQIDLMVIADRHSAHGERLLTYRQRSRNAHPYAAMKQGDLSHVLHKLRRGRFKIYIGAAPGVGKTFMMLEEAYDLKRRYIDVVGGLIETHKRKGTEAQIRDLDVLPRKVMEYRGTMFEEMDLEGILRRNPEVVLIDELAHTNIVGSKHQKRYEDVEEILEAGISVISTVNVQHLESLRDTIFQITGVRVRETIPDFILRMADEVVLIDVPPETLQQRMREGKIYTLDKAEQALANFFRQGNLIALRELALREVADHIDDRLEAHDDRSALRGPWRRMEVVYVCVNASRKAEFLIRRGFRTAHRMKATMFVSFVQVGTTLSDEELSCLEALRALTERLGGTFIHLHAQTTREIPMTLVNDMEEKLATQVVLGHSSRSRLEIRRRGNTLRTLLRSIRNVDVVVLALAP